MTLRVHHIVDGRHRFTTSTHQLVPQPSDGDRHTVPVARPAEADDYIADCAEGLARWLALGADRRHAAITRFHEVGVDNLFGIAECAADDFGISCETAVGAVQHSHRVVDDLLAAPPPPLLTRGLHVVSLPGSRVGAHFVQSVWPLLLDGSTVMIRCSPTAPRTVDFLARMSPTCGLIDGVFNVVYGFDDVLTSMAANPFVAGVIGIGQPANNRTVVSVASDVGKRSFTFDPGLA